MRRTGWAQIGHPPRPPPHLDVHSTCWLLPTPTSRTMPLLAAEYDRRPGRGATDLHNSRPDDGMVSPRSPLRHRSISQSRCTFSVWMSFFGSDDSRTIVPKLGDIYKPRCFIFGPAYVIECWEFDCRRVSDRNCRTMMQLGQSDLTNGGWPVSRSGRSWFGIASVCMFDFLRCVLTSKYRFGSCRCPSIEMPYCVLFKIVAFTTRLEFVSLVMT